MSIKLLTTPRHRRDMTESDVKSKQNKYGKPEQISVDPDRQKTVSISLLLFWFLDAWTGRKMDDP